MEGSVGFRKNKNLTLATPVKSKKFNLLTSFLSPSTERQQLRKKDSSINYSLGLKRNVKKLPKSVKSSESIYTTIGDLKVSDNLHSSEEFDLVQNVNHSDCDIPSCTDNVTVVDIHRKNSRTPLYSIVHKGKQRDNIETLETLTVQNGKVQNKILQDRLKEIADENRQLRKQVQDFVKEDKRKEDEFHAELQLRIAQLEAETRKEVKSLSYRIQILLKEKEVLNQQIDLVHQEKKELALGYDTLLDKSKDTLSSALDKQKIVELKKSLEEATQKGDKEKDEYRRQCEISEKLNDSLVNKTQELEEKLNSSVKEMKWFEEINIKLIQEKTEIFEKMEESKNMEFENQKLLLMLLKVTENIATERDILSNKISFQDNQQKELHTMIVDYSLNIGRLQEHFSNMSQENFQEILKLHLSKHSSDEHLHGFCNKQLELLREKIINQNDAMNELESENRKLECQLESILQRDNH